MTKLIKIFLEKIFNLVYPLLRPDWVQRLLRVSGFRFPYYRFAEKLNYEGLVDFEVNGKTIFIQSYNQPIEMFIFWYGIFGKWEAVQLKFWSQLVKNKFNLIIDVGANTGVYTLIASTNENSSVHAFEPVLAVREMLNKNISLNPSATNVTVYPLVLGDESKEVKFYIPRQGWVDVASLKEDFAKKFLVKDKMQVVQVQMTTIDDFLSGFSINKNTKILLKIDVEGAEDLVIAGMKGSLERFDISFMVELLTEQDYIKVTSLVTAGYKTYAINEITGNISLCSCFVDGTTNYFFTKEDSLVSFYN